jgi:hypothetical protein
VEQREAMNITATDIPAEIGTWHFRNPCLDLSCSQFCTKKPTNRAGRYVNAVITVPEKTKYMIMSRHPNSGQNQNIRTYKDS